MNDELPDFPKLPIPKEWEGLSVVEILKTIREEDLMKGLNGDAEDKRCKDCRYAFEIEITQDDIWCDLDKVNYPANMHPCNQFEEKKEAER